jgi:CDP-2,3-bis-(O-geranylgeranyl)-sn-glycerol synthase
MINYLFQAFYLALPAYLANMAPVIFGRFGWLKFLNHPIDGGKKLNGKHLFGQSKTWRGIASAVIISSAVVFIQAYLYRFYFFYDLSVFDYSDSTIVFGILSGLGAILGDLAKSFFKRRLGIKSGKSWPIFDNLDFIVGFLLFTYWLTGPSLQIIIAMLTITLVLHPLTNIIGYLLKFKKVWW